jgi:hypothetical protein
VTAVNVAAAGRLDVFEARRLTSEIRNALAVADDLLARAFAGRAWEALGHASWEAYCAAELPELRHLKMRAPARRARAAVLAGLGASVREVAAGTGASVGTAHADLATLTDTAVARVGAATAAPVSRPDLTARIVTLLAANPAGLDVFTVARRLRVRQAQASPALSRLAAAGRVEYRPGPRRGLAGRYVA